MPPPPPPPRSAPVKAPSGPITAILPSDGIQGLSQSTLDILEAYNAPNANRTLLLKQWADDRGLRPQDVSSIKLQDGRFAPYVRASGLLHKHRDDVKESRVSDPNVIANKFVWFKATLVTVKNQTFEAVGVATLESHNQVMKADTAAMARCYKRAFNFDGIVEGEL